MTFLRFAGTREITFLFSLSGNVFAAAGAVHKNHRHSHYTIVHHHHSFAILDTIVDYDDDDDDGRQQRLIPIYSFLFVPSCQRDPTTYVRSHANFVSS